MARPIVRRWSEFHPQPAKLKLLAAGIAVGDVATDGGFDRSLVSRWLLGEVRPRPEFVEFLSEYLEEPASSLFHTDAEGNFVVVRRVSAEETAVAS